MRWVVEVSSIGKTDLQKFCVEAESWQRALQAARAQRGEEGPMSGFSIELLEEGYRAVDPLARVRFVVKRAPDDMPVTAPLAKDAKGGVAPSPPSPTSAAPAAVVAAAEPKLSSTPESSPSPSSKKGGPPRPVTAVGTNGPSSKKGLGFASTDTETKSAPAGAGPAPSAPKSAPSAPKSAPAATAAVGAQLPGLPAAKVLSSREQDPTEASPLTYREYSFAVPKGTSEEAAVELLRGQLKLIDAKLAASKMGKLVNLAVFDVEFVGKPPAPPIATLTWKDWKGEPVIGYPRRGAGQKQVKPPGTPSVPPSAIFPPLSSAPRPGTTGANPAAKPASLASPSAAPAPATHGSGAGFPAVSPASQAAPQPAPVSQAAPPPAGNPFAPSPSSAPPPNPFSTTAPLIPVAAPVPQTLPQTGPQTAAQTGSIPPPAHASVPPPAISPSQPPPGAGGIPVPVVAPVTAFHPGPPGSVPPPPAFLQQPVSGSQPPPAIPVSRIPSQSHGIPASGIPGAGPPSGIAGTPSGIPAAPMGPAGVPTGAPVAGVAGAIYGSPPASAMPGGVPSAVPTSGVPASAQHAAPAPTSGSAPPPRRASSPDGMVRTPSGRFVRGRTTGDELITALFESMHDLHFLRDALDGGQFCLALATEVLPARAAIIHFFDVEKREWVVACTRGKDAGRLLTLRTPESDELLREAARKRRAVVMPNAAPSATAQRYQTLGGSRSLIIAPIMQAGRALGALEIINPLDGMPFTEDEGNAMTYIAEQYAEYLGSRGIVLDRDRIQAAATPR